MQSERDIVNKWRDLFAAGHVTNETVESAQALIDRLPLESPLRVRFGRDLDEIREHLVEPSAARTRRAKRR